jgi:hypothetical protein
MDKPTITSTAREIASLGGKVFSLAFVLTGKTVGVAHTAVDKITTYTKAGYRAQRLPKQEELPFDDAS